MLEVNVLKNSLNNHVNFIKVLVIQLHLQGRHDLLRLGPKNSNGHSSLNEMKAEFIVRSGENE